ncbi:hypothetical protein M405DRAFT_298330 [Rhizopogon salebrosus TDB-379]|nr:hypothetical protein M405DRAFT_298330 [Rhizopogon salebrosus TDB-379]
MSPLTATAHLMPHHLLLLSSTHECVGLTDSRRTRGATLANNDTLLKDVDLQGVSMAASVRREDKSRDAGTAPLHANG